METETITILPEKAITNINDDALGVDQLAIKVAKTIPVLDAKDGFVIGLHGKWGMGKTTFINFVKSEMSKIKESERPIVIDFNPWLFSGRDDLIQRFLSELALTLKEHGVAVAGEREGVVLKNAEIFTSVSEELINFSEAISTGLNAFTYAAMFHPALLFPVAAIKSIRFVIRLARKKYKENKTPENLKNKICEKLRGSTQKIVVVVDDIDRLESQEMLAIFQMVKAVANFPNVVYLLSYDQTQVAKLIKNLTHSNGIDYLEKITQYNIDLPKPSHKAVLRLFGSRIDSLVSDQNAKPFSETRWSLAYEKFLKEILETPRHAVRLANALNFSYPSLIGEVDSVDFIVLEALRMFFPKVYFEIRTNMSRYLGDGRSDKNKAYFQKVVELVPEKSREHVKSALTTLFPSVYHALIGHGAAESRSEWTTQARACSDHHLPIYFNYHPTLERLSEKEIKDAAMLVADSAKFAEFATKIGAPPEANKESNVPEYLERLQHKVKEDEFEQAVIKQLFKELIINSSHFTNDHGKENTWFGPTNGHRLESLILTILKQTPKAERFDMIKDAFLEVQRGGFISQLLFHWAEEHGLYGDKQKKMLTNDGVFLLEIEETKAISEICLARIRLDEADGKLIDETEGLIWTLYRWGDFSGSLNEPANWIRQQIASPTSLTALLERFKRNSTSSSGLKVKRSTFIDKANIKALVPLEEFDVAVQAALDVVSDAKEKEVLSLYISAN